MKTNLIKNVAKIVKNKKFLSAVAVTAASAVIILLQRKSVTTVEVDGDLVVNLNEKPESEASAE